MSLNWNIEQMEGHKALHESQSEWNRTDALIWLTIAVGMNEITEANYKEFYARVSFIEKLNGAMLNYKAGPVYFTLEQVRQRIGLTTNASTFTRLQFIKLKANRYLDEIAK